LPPLELRVDLPVALLLLPQAGLLPRLSLTEIALTLWTPRVRLHPPPHAGIILGLALQLLPRPVPHRLRHLLSFLGQLGGHFRLVLLHLLLGDHIFHSKFHSLKIDYCGLQVPLLTGWIPVPLLRRFAVVQPSRLPFLSQYTSFDGL